MNDSCVGQDSARAAHEYLAHVAPDHGDKARVQPLAEHLASVAERASMFATPFGATEWGELAGRWHDLGKFQRAFQSYIRNASGYDVETGLDGGGPGKVDHSTPGAIHAVEHLSSLGRRGRAIGRLLAYVIAGHHAGLPDWSQADGGRRSLEARLADRRSEYEGMVHVAAAQPWMQGTAPPQGPPSRTCTALWLRMLFSALVDADFLDTEAFMNPEKPGRRAGWASLTEIAGAFNRFMTVKSVGDTALNRTRSEILSWCKGAAKKKPGLFSLTVPTGGGKTLSSMAFALDHALRHGQRRIVYVIPYTSIIEQTADVFREAFGDVAHRAVLEHHSNLDPDVETARSKLAAENWDAPVVVTTSVQFFESLFAARTSRVRKLHNVADSVVVLDEVQLLPPEFLHPILDTLQKLAAHFGTTILLMTATQPAWDGAPEGDTSLPELRGVREIVPEPLELHARLRRVTVHVPEDLATEQDWGKVADELLRHPSVLCVVNRRKDARTLHELLEPRDPEAVHLSALMCGAHRSKVIGDLRLRLSAGKPVRLVSTQLIEAGVDLDFPVVFRAMAGLDSIAQAAGRCNREGKLGIGDVRVFVPPTLPPMGLLRRAEGVTRSMLAEGLDDVLAPTAFRRFFRHLYWLQGENLDKYSIRELLDHAGKGGELAYAFRTAAERFRIIRDDQQCPLVVRWPGDPRANRVEQAIAAFESDKPDRWAFRELQRSIVNLSRWQLEPLLSTGAIRQVHDRMFVQVDTTLYDERVGLRVELSEARNPEELVS